MAGNGGASGPGHLLLIEEVKVRLDPRTILLGIIWYGMISLWPAPCVWCVRLCANRCLRCKGDVGSRDNMYYYVSSP